MLKFLPFLFAGFIFSACDSTPTITKRGGCSVKEEPGWVNDDTLKITTTGAPSPIAESEIQRKTGATDAALTCAQKYVLEKFLPGGRIEGASDYRNERLSREFNGLVKGGVISKKTFDSNQNCTIIFTVSAQNLRQKLPKK